MLILHSDHIDAVGNDEDGGCCKRALFVLYFLSGVIVLFYLLGIVIVTTGVFTIFINCHTH